MGEVRIGVKIEARVSLNICVFEYRKMGLVGARGFEPPTTCTPCRCATRLRYAPNSVHFHTKPRMNHNRAAYSTLGRAG